MSDGQRGFVRWWVQQEMNGEGTKEEWVCREGCCLGNGRVIEFEKGHL